MELGDKSAQPNASASTLGDAWLDIPPLNEQRAIAEVLGAIDDKIEENRRLSPTFAMRPGGFFFAGATRGDCSPSRAWRAS